MTGRRKRKNTPPPFSDAGVGKMETNGDENEFLNIRDAIQTDAKTRRIKFPLPTPAPAVPRTCVGGP